MLLRKSTKLDNRNKARYRQSLLHNSKIVVDIEAMDVLGRIQRLKKFSYVGKIWTFWHVM